MEHINAFDQAISTGLLSADPQAQNYAGNFMYMGASGFKHCATRSYLSKCGKHLVRWSDGNFEDFKGNPTKCPQDIKCAKGKGIF